MERRSKGILAVVAPIVGTVRVAVVTINIARALDWRSMSPSSRRRHKPTPSTSLSALQVALSQHPDEHRPERPVLLAVDRDRQGPPFLMKKS
jgi:hypothetical protein